MKVLYYPEGLVFATGPELHNVAFWSYRTMTISPRKYATPELLAEVRAYVAQYAPGDVLRIAGNMTVTLGR